MVLVISEFLSPVQYLLCALGDLRSLDVGWPPVNQISIAEAVDQDIKPRGGCVL